MKKQIGWMIRGLQVAGVALCLIAVPGCDTSDPDSAGAENYFAHNPYESQPRDPSLPASLLLTPTEGSATFVGQALSFNVSGGAAPYTWSVGIPSIGSVSPATGSQTIYTSIDIGANSVIVHDSSGLSAVANISGAAMTVDPTEVTLSSNGDLATFTVTGGTAPFTWTVSDVSGFMLNAPADSNSEVYERDSPGDNSILITDSRGISVNVVIHQPL